MTPLGTVVERSSTAFLPEDAPTLHGLRVMDTAFGSGETRSYVYVVITSDDGLGVRDRRVYVDLVRMLENSDRVSEVQDYLGKPEVRESMTSTDGEATYLVVGLRSSVGSPASDEDVKWLRSVVDDLRTPTGTEVHVTGDPAMIADLTTAVNEASLKVTVVSLLLLVGILWLVYRRVATVLVSLATIGVALLCTRGALAWAGEHGLALSTYTDAFVVAITLGAGTDYCVFLISRFREEYAGGLQPLDAVAESVSRVGPALLASAATVILGAICLGFTDLAIFATTGPPMAICVAVTVAVSLTFTPALMRWFGPRIGPAPQPRADSRWARTGRLVGRHPARILVAGLTVLILLALALPTMQPLLRRTRRPAARHSQQPRTRGDGGALPAQPDAARLPAHSFRPRHGQHPRPGRHQRHQHCRGQGRRCRPGPQHHQTGWDTARTRIHRQPDSGSSPKDSARRRTRLEAGEPGLKRLAFGAGDLSDALGQVSAGAGKAEQGAGKLSDGSRLIADGLGQAADRTDQAADGARQPARRCRYLGRRTPHRPRPGRRGRRRSRDDRRGPRGRSDLHRRPDLQAFP
ncbi:MMPL family transporter [Nocardioides sp. W3-2-3]|uniref:MMPL family transporter n=1 Tax=Nocardioides convexus TaxID=2712224 RepID=UPI00241863BF|nr:MMPL family transporter [Nocardioides convexus]NGZ99557.1 MMPL family transporter [Nocardioides convexus]